MVGTIFHIRATFSIGDSNEQIKICSSFFNHLTTLTYSVIYGFFGSLGTKIKNEDVQTIDNKISLYPKPIIVKLKKSTNNLPKNKIQKVNKKPQN